MTRPRLPLEILIMIAENLHHVDLVNLSRSPTSLRRAFFGDEDPQGVTGMLKRYTCSEPAASPKTACAVCRGLMCRVSHSPQHRVCALNGKTLQDCRAPGTVQVPRPAAFRHLTRCLPACSKCFFQKYCVSKWWSGLGAPLRDVERQGGTFPQGQAQVCRLCVALSPEDRAATLERAWTREVQRLERLRLACFVCNRALPETGMRWWIDAVAGEECLWEGHPGWM
jgi:hypothetical protein